MNSQPFALVHTFLVRTGHTGGQDSEARAFATVGAAFQARRMGDQVSVRVVRDGQTMGEYGVLRP